MKKEIIKLISAPSSKVDKIPIKNGQLIFSYDDNQVYLDLKSLRTKYSCIKVLTNDSDRMKENVTYYTGFYWIAETNTLWRFCNNHWTQITPSNLQPLVFCENGILPKRGNKESLYITDSIIWKWNEQEAKFEIVANKTQWKELKVTE